MQAWKALVLAGAMTVVGGCKEDSTAPAPPLTTVVVAPAAATLTIGSTHQFAATGTDINGNEVTPLEWVWTSTGGTVSSTGLFTAGLVVGTFANAVAARTGAISGYATVTVSAGPLATVTVAPTTSTLAINGTQQFTAVGKDAGGNVLTITPTWSVAAGGGTITSAGLFTAGTVPGTYTGTVTATVGSLAGTATVVVTVGAVATIAVTPASSGLEVSTTRQFTAVARDVGGNVVTGAVVWSVVAGGGTINGTGLFTAGTVAGVFLNTVQAAIGSVSGRASVTVTDIGSGVAHGPAPVLLGSAGNFVILAKAAISTVPTSAITGDLGLSPAAASFITGFSLILPAGGAFSTSSQVTGNVYASDYAVPTPSNLTTAIGDMETAYTDAAGRVTPDYVELATGDISGLTLAAGLYKWSNTVTILSDVTLLGGPNDVWIFQIGGGITQASGTRVTLSGGAQAKNVFWQSFGVVDVGTTAHMEGIVLSQTSITLQTGASANGRLLAQTAVTLASSTVVEP